MHPSPLQLDRHFFTKIYLDAHPDAGQDVKPEVHTEVDLARATDDPKRYQLTLRLRLQSPPDKKAPYTAEIHVVGLLHVTNTWPESQIQKLVEANGPALLYGAAREMICNLTSRGPWPMVCVHSVSFIHPKAQQPTQPPAESSASRAK